MKNAKVDVIIYSVNRGITRLFVFKNLTTIDYTFDYTFLVESVDDTENTVKNGMEMVENRRFGIQKTLY